MLALIAVKSMSDVANSISSMFVLNLTVVSLVSDTVNCFFDFLVSVMDALNLRRLKLCDDLFAKRDVQ